MELKWIAGVVIFAIATAIYARTMRVHGHASWGEIVLPWRRSARVVSSSEVREAKGAADGG
jgi:hypothetical protein